MTSVKCFGSWLKEAGRGHLTALFGWTTFFIYTVLLVMRLSLDTSYTFFGIGNTVLLWLSMGLHIIQAEIQTSLQIRSHRKKIISILYEM